MADILNSPGYRSSIGIPTGPYARKIEVDVPEWWRHIYFIAKNENGTIAYCSEASFPPRRDGGRIPEYVYGEPWDAGKLWIVEIDEEELKRFEEIAQLPRHWTYGWAHPIRWHNRDCEDDPLQHHTCKKQQWLDQSIAIYDKK
jgi:hypothetical protein